MDTSRVLLTGRVAIVTGGARGLGRGFAEGLAAFGAKVAIADRKEDAAEEAAGAIRARGHEAIAIGCDVRDGAQVRGLVERAVQELGGVDVLVNNVGGIYLGRDRPPMAPFVEQTEEDWDDSYALNLKSAFLCTHAAANAMIAQGRGGSIINVASSEALRAAPNFAPYAAYKAALVNFTRSLALELAPHAIRVNCIAPDAIPTESLTKGFPELAADEAYRHHVPLARAGRAEEAAGVVVFLASDLSSFVTGVTVPVEGGMLTAGGWLHHPEHGWIVDPKRFERPGR
jgi:NAD(P)-dependent dehydrogenase (short-subunit alcohol dehydrogenase family)